MGTPDRDTHLIFERMAVLWWDHTTKAELGMVSRVVPRAELADVTFAMADRIAAMPSFGLALAKRAVNKCEDLMGLRSGADSVFGLHHAAHAHNAETSADSLASMDARSMKASATAAPGQEETGRWS